MDLGSQQDVPCLSLKGFKDQGIKHKNVLASDISKHAKRFIMKNTPPSRCHLWSESKEQHVTFQISSGDLNNHVFQTSSFFLATETVLRWCAQPKCPFFAWHGFIHIWLSLPKLFHGREAPRFRKSPKGLQLHNWRASLFCFRCFQRSNSARSDQKGSEPKSKNAQSLNQSKLKA